MAASLDLTRSSRSAGGSGREISRKTLEMSLFISSMRLQDLQPAVWKCRSCSSPGPDLPSMTLSISSRASLHFISNAPMPR